MATNSVGNKRSARKRKGFSLIELLVSVGIIATVLTYVIGIFTTGMRANRKAIDLTAGTLVAESVITHELYGILADSNKSNSFFKTNNSTSDSNNPFVQGTETLGNTKFTYKMFVTNVGNFTETGNKMKKVDVQVWWWNTEDTEGTTLTEDQKKWRAGYGVVSVGLTRLINQQSRF